jgi:hypothetical protein
MEESEFAFLKSIVLGGAGTRAVEWPSPSALFGVENIPPYGCG